MASVLLLNHTCLSVQSHHCLIPSSSSPIDSIRAVVILWRLGGIITRRAIHEGLYSSFCVQILRTQILTCVTLFTKLSYARKIINLYVNIRTV